MYTVTFGSLKNFMSCYILIVWEKFPEKLFLNLNVVSVLKMICFSLLIGAESIIFLYWSWKSKIKMRGFTDDFLKMIHVSIMSFAIYFQYNIHRQLSYFHEYIRFYLISFGW